MTLYRAPAQARTGRLGLMLRRVVTAAHQFEGNKLSPAFILHWMAKYNDLRMWEWPADEDGNRIPPDELSAHKLTHLFLGPCCLCAYRDDTSRYTEATIHLLEAVNANRNDPKRRPFIGEWVAQCTRDNSCGYFVVLERFYACKVLLTRKYAKQDKPLKANMWDFMKEETDEDMLLSGVDTGLRRIFTPHTDDENFSRSKNELKRIREEFPEEVEETESRISSLDKEGLPASEFWKLFVQCAKCGFVMGRHQYPYSHRCPKQLRPLEDEAGAGDAIDGQNNGREEGEDGSAGGYDYYLQFASVPTTPEDLSDKLDWEIDPDDFPGPDEQDDDNLPEFSAVLAQMCSSRGASLQ